MSGQKSNPQEVPLSIILRVQPIGEIAVRNGLLTTQQVVRVCNEQQHCRMLFSELAKKLGFLTAEQLEFLIEAKQQYDRIVDESMLLKTFRCCQATLQACVKHLPNTVNSRRTLK